MTDRHTDIPELHAALVAAAAARAPRTTVRPARTIRLRTAAALCALILGLVGVLGVGAAAEPARTPVAGPDASLGLGPSPGLLRCVLASIPASLLPGPEVSRDDLAC